MNGKAWDKDRLIVPVKYSVKVPSGATFTVCQPSSASDFNGLSVYDGSGCTIRRNAMHALHTLLGR